MRDAEQMSPLQVFRFHVEFQQDSLTQNGKRGKPDPPMPDPLCRGAFSECTGLEATMEPKVIKEGGRNYGAAQRVGTVTFSTVILKRGITSTQDLWTWFALVNGGSYATRLSVIITVNDIENNPVLIWTLSNALPIKFKTADLNAKGTEVGIEELHLAHEGLVLAKPGTARPQ